MCGCVRQADTHSLLVQGSSRVLSVTWARDKTTQQLLAPRTEGPAANNQGRDMWFWTARVPQASRPQHCSSGHRALWSVTLGTPKFAGEHGPGRPCRGSFGRLISLAKSKSMFRERQRIRGSDTAMRSSGCAGRPLRAESVLECARAACSDCLGGARRPRSAPRTRTGRGPRTIRAAMRSSVEARCCVWVACLASMAIDWALVSGVGQHAGFLLYAAMRRTPIDPRLIGMRWASVRGCWGTGSEGKCRGCWGTGSAGKCPRLSGDLPRGSLCILRVSRG